jgi:hypothetical protein
MWHAADPPHNTLSAITANTSAELSSDDTKMHSVCTVQVFRSPYSGLYLYMFASYYLSLGYVVIIYDR